MEKTAPMIREDGPRYFMLFQSMGEKCVDQTNAKNEVPNMRLSGQHIPHISMISQTSALYVGQNMLMTHSKIPNIIC